MAFERIALHAGGVARAERIRYAQALARGIVALVIDLDAKARLPQEDNPVFTAAATRVFPYFDRYRRLRADGRCGQQRKAYLQALAARRFSACAHRVAPCFLPTLCP